MKLRSALVGLAALVTVAAGCVDGNELPDKDKYFRNTLFFMGNGMTHELIRDQNGNLAAVKVTPPGGISECFYAPEKEDYCLNSAARPMDQETRIAVMEELDAENLARYQLELMRRTHKPELK